MLDSKIRSIIDPPLNTIARFIVRLKISANMMTSTGLFFAGLCFYALSTQYYMLALCFLVMNRLCDGLDGPIARNCNARSAQPVKSKASGHFGGYYDILSDFVLYAGFPFFFVLGAPDNVLQGAFLLFAIVLSAVSFLGYAIMAEKAQMQTDAQGQKGFYYMAGLMEGTETIIFLCLMCLFPQYFSALALTFGGLCLLTVVIRLMLAWRVFKP
jgi:phosphatidylglycerophosphate synthase